MSFGVSAPVENNAGATTGTVTLTGVPSLATINVLIRYGASDGPVVSVSDGSAYSAVAAEVVTGSSFNVDLYQLQSVASGTHVITVTITGGMAFFYIGAWYITGNGALTGTAGSFDTGFPGTGANIISAPAITTAVAGALVLCAGSSNDASNTMTAGTSPNAFTSVGLTFAGNFAEYFVQSAAGAITPTAGQTVSDRSGVFTWAYGPAASTYTLAASPGTLNLAGANENSSFQFDLRPGSFALSGQPTSSGAVLPNILGLTTVQANAVLNAAGYNNIGVGSIYDIITAPGLVVSQTPIGGTLWPFASLVSYLFSAGPFVPLPPALPPMKVTTRAFSLEEMVAREWGPSFRAPDHRVYLFSNNRGFDSTDLGNTGIYQKGTRTS